MDYKYSFLLTFISGFFTMIGAFIIFIKSKNINSIINMSLSFASGVMLCVSILDLLPESYKMLLITYNYIPSILIILIFILIGFLIGNLLDKLSIHMDNNLYKVGLLSFIIIIIHNLPEGILTFMTSNINKSLGLDMAISIAMHNLPEGMIISIPIFYSTNSKFKALSYSFVASISEPLGALIAYLFLSKYINSIFIGFLLSFISGLMIYISIFELLREAINHKQLFLTFVFITLGSIFMYVNLYVF